MNPLELLIFRNYSGIEEPAFSSPIGYISIRNIIVFTIFGGITLALHKLIMPDNVEISRDIIQVSIVLIPVIIGLVLVMIKPQFGTADSILLSLVYISQNKNKKDRIKLKSKQKSKSTVLGFAKSIKKEKVADSDIVKEIVCSDLDELKSIKIELQSGDGEMLADKLVKCYIDDVLTETVKTSLDGVVVIKVRPERIGRKQMIIRDDANKIMLQKTFLFKKK